MFLSRHHPASRTYAKVSSGRKNTGLVQLEPGDVLDTIHGHPPPYPYCCRALASSLRRTQRGIAPRHRAPYEKVKRISAKPVRKTSIKKACKISTNQPRGPTRRPLYLPQTRTSVASLDMLLKMAKNELAVQPATRQRFFDQPAKARKIVPCMRARRHAQESRDCPAHRCEDILPVRPPRLRVPQISQAKSAAHILIEQHQLLYLPGQPHRAQENFWCPRFDEGPLNFHLGRVGLACRATAANGFR